MDTQQHRQGLNQVRKWFECDELVLPTHRIPGLGASVCHVLFKAPRDMAMADVARYTELPKLKKRCAHTWRVVREVYVEAGEGSAAQPPAAAGDGGGSAPLAARAQPGRRAGEGWRETATSLGGGLKHGGSASAATFGAAALQAAPPCWRAHDLQCQQCEIMLCRVMLDTVHVQFPRQWLLDVDASTWSRFLMWHPEVSLAPPSAAYTMPAAGERRSVHVDEVPHSQRDAIVRGVQALQAAMRA